ncbi:MAG: amidohydrolase family protein [Ilumatobacter sp.]|nr:amidohydrolase family protein [Ilumatobacter sp.]
MPRRRDDDLPLRFHPLSNGEYAPLRPSPVVDEAIRRTLDLATTNARRTGMSRRTFLRSASGMAATLTALAACSSDARRSRPSATGAPASTASSTTTTTTADVGAGGTFDLPPEATIDTEVATSVLGGTDGELVVDVQTHLLDLPAGTTRGFGAGFPQADCGGTLDECFGTDAWLDLVLGGSDTTVAVLSAIPVVADPDPLSVEVMTRARAQAEALGCSDRVLLQGHATPTLGRLDDALDAMSATAAEFDIAAWKAYTHEGPHWRLDDDIGTAFIGRARDLGQRIICVHKGLGPAAASPADVGPAAVANPDMQFCIYHSGFEVRVTEGPYPGAPDGAAAGGVDRLVASIEAAGLAPGANVYAELGSTWWNLIQRPDEAAHVLGKLLLAVGPDNVLWGTDSIWYGSPQGQIEAFRAFRISPEFQDRYGYPALTDEVKARILGLNAADLYGVDRSVAACQPSTDDRAALRAELDDRDVGGLHGPTTAAGARQVFAAEHPWFG